MQIIEQMTGLPAKRGTAALLHQTRPRVFSCFGFLSQVDCTGNVTLPFVLRALGDGRLLVHVCMCATVCLCASRSTATMPWKITEDPQAMSDLLDTSIQGGLVRGVPRCVFLPIKQMIVSRVGLQKDKVNGRKQGISTPDADVDF